MAIKLGSNNQEASPSAGKNTGVVLVPFSRMEVRPYNFVGSVELMLEFLKAPFLVLHFFYYTLMTFLMMLSVLLVSMLMILLSIVSVISIWFVATTWIGFWTWICSTRRCGLRKEVACWFQCWKTQFYQFYIYWYFCLKQCFRFWLFFLL